MKKLKTIKERAARALGFREDFTPPDEVLLDESLRWLAKKCRTFQITTGNGRKWFVAANVGSPTKFSAMEDSRQLINAVVRVVVQVAESLESKNA